MSLERLLKTLNQVGWTTVLSLPTPSWQHVTNNRRKSWRTHILAVHHVVLIRKVVYLMVPTLIFSNVANVGISFATNVAR